MGKYEEITVSIKATVKVTFAGYGRESLNDKAKEQISIWVKETLDDADSIPLFVNSNFGEESTSKTVFVEVDNE